jgi:hypothetical protein
MIAKKATAMSASTLDYWQELDSLYARRSAIDSLIESLVRYDRTRESHSDDSDRQAG